MATVPELPGAVTEGRDLEEARARIGKGSSCSAGVSPERPKGGPDNSQWETISVAVPFS